VYLSFSLENIITIGVMLLVWMLAIHLLGQMGVHVASWIPGSGG
jgi:TM2 domain-containing membrane protein YozV